MYQKQQTILSDIITLALGMIAMGLILLGAMFIFGQLS